MMSKLARTRKGFTLIEMLIVIVVIAILALIVIPRLLGAGRRAKESALRGDLQQLRNAIQQFEADCGDFPLTLDQLVAANGAAIAGNGGQGYQHRPCRQVRQAGCEDGARPALFLPAPPPRL